VVVGFGAVVVVVGLAVVVVVVALTVVVVGFGLAVVEVVVVGAAVVVVGGSVVVVVSTGFAAANDSDAERLERPVSAKRSIRSEASSTSSSRVAVDGEPAERRSPAGAESETAAREARGTSTMPAHSASAGSQRRP
jgi:hypothetical protein